MWEGSGPQLAREEKIDDRADVWLYTCVVPTRTGPSLPLLPPLLPPFPPLPFPPLPSPTAQSSSGDRQ